VKAIRHQQKTLKYAQAGPEADMSSEVSQKLCPPGENVPRDMPAPPANGQPQRPCTPA
jgi:hypothetical protein